MKRLAAEAPPFFLVSAASSSSKNNNSTINTTEAIEELGFYTDVTIGSRNVNDRSKELDKITSYKLLGCHGMWYLIQDDDDEPTLDDNSTQPTGDEYWER